MSSTSILLIHGPNLNLLGTREPEIYGSSTLDDHVAAAGAAAEDRGFAVVAIQSNSESEIVDEIQRAREKHSAIIINAGALTHYSWSIHDALRSFPGPVIEVHLSNPGAREDFRHVSVLSSVVNGTISGFGADGYRLAVEAATSLVRR